MKEKKSMTTASKITLVRILMIPVFLFFMLSAYIPYHTVIAMVIFIIASATDCVDGYIARNYNQITNFGKFVDPLADKLLIVSALVAFVHLDVIGCIPVIIIIAREFVVTGLRTVAMSSGRVIAAGFSGKLKTVTQIVVIVLLLAMKFSVETLGYQWEGALAFGIVKECATWLMVSITLYSGAEYLVKNWSVIDYTK